MNRHTETSLADNAIKMEASIETASDQSVSLTSQ